MSYRVLLVDDDRETRELFRTYLGENYEIIDATSGSQAIELLKKPHDVDVVVLDVVLPGTRGTEVLREIKKLCPELAVVIWTAYSTKDVAVSALKGHADEYVEKPFSTAKLKEVIDRILRSKNGHDRLDACDTHGKIEKVKEFTGRNVDKQVRLTDAASIVCLSPKYLSRVFKQETGKSFGRFKSELKVEKAKEYLSTTGYNVKQISDRLGYQNVESFIRTFRRVAHCTPSTYRNSVKSSRQSLTASDQVEKSS